MCWPSRTRISSRPLPGGHGLAQIRTLLKQGVGTSEQYASAYAVLARALGYQSRVVVGFHTGDGESGVYRVTGQMVHAWAEVRFETLGWVRFEPTPTTGSDGPGEQEPEPSAAGAPEQPDPEREPQPGTAGAGQDRDSSGAGTPLVAWYAGLALASLLGLLVLGAAAVPLAKRGLRRRRRTSADPDRRALGAWRDTLDRLIEAGLPVTAANTSGEVVSAAQHGLNDRVTVPVRELARLQDAAAYAPDHLSTVEADAAWRHADQARRALRGSARPIARLRAALSPRPLLRRREGGLPPSRRWRLLPARVVP